MPWKIVDDHPDCSGYAVVKEGTTTIVPGGCHMTRPDAEDHMKALYANEKNGDRFGYDPDVRVHVRSQPKTYRPDGGYSFFLDLLAANAPGEAGVHPSRRAEAAERLRRHQEEHRDVGSTAFVGAIVPQYLTALASSVVRVGSPLVEALPGMDLPAEGMAMTLPRSTSALVGTSAATQTENTATAETDPAYTDVTEPVVTVAGQIDTSFQLIDRGGPATDRFLAADVVEAVDDALDQQVLAGDGTGNQMTGILSTTGITTVTWTDTSPTRYELVQRIARTAGDVAGARRRVPTVVIMHSRRWFWLVGADATVDFDSISQPMTHAGAEGHRPAPGPWVGVLGNMGIIVDDHIPTNIGAATNQDVVAVVRAEDLPVFTSPISVRVERNTRANALGARIVGYRYAWFSGERFNGRAIGVLTGTGLVDPGAW